MSSIRNLAIVAHVDHGKTTLVDAMFRYAGTIRSNQQLAERALDSQDQERERGITILAKTTAIEYEGIRINIVDTPGHADFGGQVERTLTMADAVLLLVDSHEGPMPQTRFVLRKAFEAGLKALVMINKIDRPDQRADVVLDEIFDLFVELGANEDQLDFPVVYGSGRDGYAFNDVPKDLDNAIKSGDLNPLFSMLLREIPMPDVDGTGQLQFQVSTIDYDDFLGRIGVGRVKRGHLKMGMRAALCHPDRDKPINGQIKNLFRYEGLKRTAVEEVEAGDIAVIAGLEELKIGDTICAPDHIDPLPAILIDEPTISMVMQVNDSPFAGREGKFVTSRQVKDRLERAALRDVAMLVEPGQTSDAFIVKGRGVMHIGVLIETMRREGFEFAVGKPQVILKEVEGTRCEPFERATIEVPTDFAGKLIEYLGRRRGELLNMESLGPTTKLELSVPARGLIGARTAILTLSAGEAIFSHVFDQWKKDGGPIPRRSNGVLVSDRSGPVVPYALDSLSDRGVFFVRPGDEVYNGMVVGENNRNEDLTMNVCRTKKLTNIRSANKDSGAFLTAPRIMSLEEALEYIEDDELLEVTPETLRLRKRELDADKRKKSARSAKVHS